MSPRRQPTDTDRLHSALSNVMLVRAAHPETEKSARRIESDIMRMLQTLVLKEVQNRRPSQ